MPPVSLGVVRANRSRIGRMTAAALTVITASAVLAAVPSGPVAAQSVPSSGGVVVIANGWSPPDVGAAAPLAGRLDAVVLYASMNALGQPTIDALEELNPSRVLLMGGPVALTPAVASEVRRVLRGARVERFSGTDRIDTAAKAALSAPAVPAGRPVVIANGWSSPDVGAAAPLAVSLGGSVLFAEEGSLGTPTIDALRRLAPSRIIIVGGANALSSDIESQLESVLPGTPTERLDGVDRVDTAAQGAALGEVALGEPVVLANGWEAADVGIAAPLTASLGGSVLFTEQDELGERTTEALESLSPSRIILIGASDRLAETIDADLVQQHPGTPRVRIAGSDRIETAAIAALFGVQFSAEQQRFEDAVATIIPGEADCDTAPQLGVEGIEVVDPPADLNDPTAHLTVAEVVRIAGGCALVDYVRLNGRSVAKVRELLADEPSVFAVSEPIRGFELLHPHESHLSENREQFHTGLALADMERLWDEWNPKNNITVAVIDSGVDIAHPDLDGRFGTVLLTECHIDERWTSGRKGHGTHVAGIIAAERGNGGTTGVAPSAMLFPINSFAENDCAGSRDSVVVAVARALMQGVRVINMSFGYNYASLDSEFCSSFGSEIETRGEDDWRLSSDENIEIQNRIWTLEANCDAFRQLLDIAEALGVVTVASAGNCGPSTWKSQHCPSVNAFSLPAAYSTTIAVAAVQTDGNYATFSTANEYVDIAAPGEKIISTLPTTSPALQDEHYGLKSGTSMASPFVAGVVAHMLNRYPQARPADVQRALTDTAGDPNTSDRDDEYGYGIVQPRQAIWRLREILGLNRISNIRVQASSCAPADETPSCPDPLRLELYPTFSADSYPRLRNYTVEVPRDLSYITTTTNYDSDGRPGSLSFSLLDSEDKLAGHQFTIGSDRQELSIGLSDWKGDGYRPEQPFSLTFVRAGADQPVTEPAESEPRFAALRVWSGSCNRDFGPQKCAGDSAVPTVPTFSPDVTSYTVTVPRGTEFVTLGATPAEGFTLSARSSPPDVARIPGYQVRISQPAAASTEGKADKPGTSAAIGERFLEVVGDDWSGAVIVASSENFPDGLAAASLASALRAPILLTPRNRLDPSIAEFVRDRRVREVFIMGGPAAISESVERELRSALGGGFVTRLWGQDRYETAIKIAERVATANGSVGDLCGTSQKSVFIATGLASADALAVSPAAYAAKMPVLLVDPKARTLPNGVRAFIRTHGIETAVILGGTSAVPERLQQALSQLGSINRVARVAGADRFETAAGLATDIVSRCYDHVETIGLANGQGFADALAAGPLTAELKGVMLLTGPDDVPPATLDAMTQIGKEAQVANISLALLAVGDIAEADNAVTEANNTAGQQLHGQPAIGAVKSVAAGRNRTCAIKTDRTIHCWGDDPDGNADPPPGQFTALSAGIDGTRWRACGIRTDRTIACWTYGQRLQSPTGEFIDISVGHADSCGIRTDSTIHCWSNTTLGRFGRQVPPSGQFIAISTGKNHACGIRDDGSIQCFGYYGGVHTLQATGPFTAVSTGSRHTCAIRTNGTVQCWGVNGWGESDAPSGRFTAINAGSSHTCGIRTDGTAQCWGYGDDGGRSDPPQGQFTAITAGLGHSCGIKTDGNASCWGGNNWGGNNPPPGRFQTEPPSQPGLDTSPLTTDIETISVPADSTSTTSGITTVTLVVAANVDSDRTTTYQLVINTE